LGQVQDIFACPVNRPARGLPVPLKLSLWLPGWCGSRA